MKRKLNILLSGVETNNKGAELMLYAILQEIERRHPTAKVYIPFPNIQHGLKYVKTNIHIRTTPLSRLTMKLHLPELFWALHLPQYVLANTYLIKSADIFIDGSGFAFGDQLDIGKYGLGFWRTILRPLHKRGCKIVFLPQAFGPVNNQGTKEAFSLLNQYVDLLMPREQISYNYLRDSKLVDMRKVRVFTDFTSLVDGVFPSKYEHLRNGICIIPNMQMIRKKQISYDNYIKLLTYIAKECKDSGHTVYLLNHEGRHDADLCVECKKSMGGKIEAVTDLNALEVKGLISSAYIVISSRFHGLVSSLNSCVPAVATSWSHKYGALFHDYDMDDYLLPLNDLDLAINLVKNILESKRNAFIREHLKKRLPLIQEQTREMWDFVWNILESK
ncbi:MAG: polysaccharide pyruvyl transferase family protein [Bacteroidales bacterium]|nr:polysaccharide pyruvyl transferase family protein [Bacteroidales bacterium]